MDKKDFYNKNISITEWFEAAGHKDVRELKEEDATRDDRLKTLNEIANVPFDNSTLFPAHELKNISPKVRNFINQHSTELCALRLAPLDMSLPKLRLRGNTVAEAYEWFKSLDIDPSKYIAAFKPHSENHLWSTIFVINQDGIFGEVIEGAHIQLTQGYFEGRKPVRFSYDFKNWVVDDSNQDMQDHLNEIINCLYIADTAIQKKLEDNLKASFSHNYLLGYFETVLTTDFGLWFIDYNRLIGTDIKLSLSKPASFTSNEPLIIGIPASNGECTGKIKIVSEEDIINQDIGEIEADSILVCDYTTPLFVPYMKKCVGIITQRGGILSHAAIVAREMKVPCIVGVDGILTKLKTGDEVTMDATNGLVSKK